MSSWSAAVWEPGMSWYRHTFSPLDLFWKHLCQCIVNRYTMWTEAIAYLKPDLFPYKIQQSTNYNVSTNIALFLQNHKVIESKIFFFSKIHFFSFLFSRILFSGINLWNYTPKQNNKPKQIRTKKGGKSKNSVLAFLNLHFSSRRNLQTWAVWNILTLRLSWCCVCTFVLKWRNTMQL